MRAQAPFPAQGAAVAERAAVAPHGGQVCEPAIAVMPVTASVVTGVPASVVTGVVAVAHGSAPNHGVPTGVGGIWAHTSHVRSGEASRHQDEQNHKADSVAPPNCATGCHVFPFVLVPSVIFG